MENLGILAALGAAVFWGSYTVPFKVSASKNLLQFQAIMAVGIGLSGLVVSILLGYPLDLNIFGLLSGVLWAFANAVSLIAVLNLGLSRAVPVMSSLVVIGSFFWGAFVFHELSGLMTGLLGIGLIILGVIFVSSIGKTERRNVKKGLLAAVIAGSVWSSQMAPIKLGHVSPNEFFFPVCFGVLVTGVLVFIVSRAKFERKAIGMSLLSGVLWNAGNLASIISIPLIGLSKALPVSQSASLVAVLWGVLYFKEITQKRQKLQVLIGAIILLVGVAILSQA